MKYPKIKIDGKLIKLNKRLFEFVQKTIKNSNRFDNRENELGLTLKDIQLLSWNSATMLFPFIQTTREKDTLEHLLYVFNELEPNANRERILEYIIKYLKGSK